jgi:hypothetical protein
MTNVQFELLAKLIRININKSISKELASIEVRVENDSLVVYLYPVENSSLINKLNLVENKWVGYGFLFEKDESFLPAGCSIESILIDSYKGEGSVNACVDFIKMLNETVQ